MGCLTPSLVMLLQCKSPLDEGVAISTIHSAKGLEWDGACCGWGEIVERQQWEGAGGGRSCQHPRGWSGAARCRGGHVCSRVRMGRWSMRPSGSTSPQTRTFASACHVQLCSARAGARAASLGRSPLMPRCAPPVPAAAAAVAAAAAASASADAISGRHQQQPSAYHAPAVCAGTGAEAGAAAADWSGGGEAASGGRPGNM